MDTIFCIDIGSNSVRLAKIVEGKTIYKLMETTQLSERLSINGFLNDYAMERTMNAVKKFVDIALKENKKPFIFGTESFRRATNGKTFANEIYENCGFAVDILDGKTEAVIGYMGAGGQKENGITVIDIGGASTEIICGEKEDIKFLTSLTIGVVTLKDKCGNNKDKLIKYIDEKLQDVNCKFYKKCIGIGGTATSLAAIDLELEVYDVAKVDGHKISIKRLKEIADKLLSLNVEQIKKLKGVHEKRAEVITGGAMLMLKILELSNTDTLYISESDNLEGYAILKGLVKV